MIDQRGSSDQSKSANGECPGCAMPVPFKRANFKRGQPFACKGCGRNLQTSKASVPLALAAFGLASLLGKTFGILAVAGVLIALVTYEWITVRVRFVDDVQNAASSK